MQQLIAVTLDPFVQFLETAQCQYQRWDHETLLRHLMGVVGASAMELQIIDTTVVSSAISVWPIVCFALAPTPVSCSIGPQDTKTCLLPTRIGDFVRTVGVTFTRMATRASWVGHRLAPMVARAEFCIADEFATMPARPVRGGRGEGNRVLKALPPEGLGKDIIPLGR